MEDIRMLLRKDFTENQVEILMHLREKGRVEVIRMESGQGAVVIWEYNGTSYMFAVRPALTTWNGVAFLPRGKESIKIDLSSLSCQAFYIRLCYFVYPKKLSFWEAQCEFMKQPVSCPQCKNVLPLEELIEDATCPSCSQINMCT